MDGGRRGRNLDVLVLGAGYAGLMAALALRGSRKPLRIGLVNDRPQFVERIRLQEAIGRPLAPRLPPYPELLEGSGVRFIEGRVTGLDADRGEARVETGLIEQVLRFETCIYALGSRTDLSTPGVAKHAYRLDHGDRPLGPAALREALSGADARAVAVVGGGATAMEAAAEIKTTWPRHSVALISEGTTGEIGKGQKVRDLARQELAGLGIELIDHELVLAVEPRGLVTASGDRVCDLCVWAAGMRASSIARAAGLAVDDHNRVWVDPFLRSVSHRRILAVGDAARPAAPSGAAYRPSALAALTSGAFAAQSLWQGNPPSPRPFSFSAFGQGIALGRRGLGFFVYPDDGDGYGVSSGTRELKTRNGFVRALLFFLNSQRRWPGRFPFWVGRSRVSWAEASSAMHAARMGAPERGPPGEDDPCPVRRFRRFI